MHLQGLRGKDGILKADTIRRLHTPPGKSDAAFGYACGWVVQRTASGEPVHWHNGSVGTFYARATIYPECDLAVVCAMNIGYGESAAYALTQRIHSVMSKHEKRTVK